MDPAAMEPYARALLDYDRGDLSAVMIIQREDGYRSEETLKGFFNTAAEFDPITRRSLELCRGSVLDVGAGAGRVSLALQERELEVTAIDVAAPAVEIMRSRGVQRVTQADFFDFSGGPFDTILLTMHGIGMVETLAGLDRFLLKASEMLRPEGQVLLDSMDVRCTTNEMHLAYQKNLQAQGRYIGEVRMQFEYKGCVGAVFGWLHADPETLAQHARAAGWQVDILAQEPGGDYLARLTR